jgi:hypothetical protein
MYRLHAYNGGYGVMDDTTRNEIAECLERLASQPAWNAELWQRCYDLVGANADDELLA